MALRQLNAALAYLLLNFDLRLSDDFDSKAFWDNIDNFRTTIIKLPLWVHATPRQR